MGSRYERYIFHMCTMRIVAKLINFEQIQPSKKTNIRNNFFIKKNIIFYTSLEIPYAKALY